MVPDNRFEIVPVKRPHNSSANDRMRADFVGLAGSQRAGFTEDVAVHADLADIVENRCYTQVEDPFLIETAVLPRDDFNVSLHAIAMSGGIWIFGFYGPCMGPNRR